MKKKVGLVVKTTLNSLLILVLVVAMVLVNSVIPGFARMGNAVMNGFDKKIDNSKVDTTGLNLDYYETDYTAEKIAEAEKALAYQIAAEGNVLLMNNDNALP